MAIIGCSLKERRPHFGSLVHAVNGLSVLTIVATLGLLLCLPWLAFAPLAFWTGLLQIGSL